ncbi:hypothetical protein A2526_03510 [candidate division WOR-1 bacterium RIFOXYD2_FULL_36_8]|nr:MAG: hypothetical protein A2230_04710 [candidate division WOR-1 bacterium RIFOXYA2_FULL_36_21]OGC39195.1 MAG: hypothetical protein A2526_03510 [candidate division WOR-1 bacterium RIFOXYD2_FULL_36_8]
MNTGITLFTQVMSFAPRYDFRQCVKHYHGDYKVKTFSCWEQYLCMAFAQLTYRESLRDIETCLRAMKPKLHNSGLQSGIARNTLANANSVRDWRIYADFAQIFIQKAKKLYAKEWDQFDKKIS